ncbi:hypothetical protein GX586_08885, partial [bacterium]|nr:hypothetical protein [bacterium]
MNNAVTEAVDAGGFQGMSVWTARARRGAALLAVCAAAAVLWHAYGPGPGGGPAAFVPSLTRGEALRLTCYAAAGGVGVVTALAPLAGLCLLAFLIPLINSVPLLINSGAPYPVVLFAGIGCLAGWLVNEAVHPRPLEAFRGRFWLVAFGVFLAIGAWASLVRYHPRWQWDMPELLGQPVNVKGMLRGDAVRYIWFVLVNGVLWIALVIATQSILARHRARGTRPGTALIWSLLAGALGAACMAVYQIGLTVNWFGEAYKLVPSHIHFGANTSYYWTRLNRANGTCTDPNALGTLIGLCIPFAAARVVFAGSWTSAGSWIQRCVALAITVIYAFGIQYSGSRSGLLAALLACALTIVVGLVYAADSFLRRRGAPIWSRVLAATVIAGLFAYAFIFLPTLINVADRRLQITQSSSSLARRLKRDFRLFQQRQNIFDMIKDNRRMQYWRYARRIWMEYPLTGIGLGSYVIELPNYCAANR